MKKAFVIVVSSILMFTMTAMSPLGTIPVLRLIPYPPVPDCVYYPIDYEGYMYSLRPGMGEWAKLDSNMQMLAAVQIPEGILAGMSTKVMAQSAACYPKLGDMILFGSNKMGFEAVFTNANVLQALSKREDAREELQALLEDKNWVAAGKYPWGYNPAYVTIILQAEEFGGEGLPDERWEVIDS